MRMQESASLVWVLCLVLGAPCWAVPAGQWQGVGGGHPQLALEDDVNILMYGVLQFSAGLREMYRGTSSRFTQIFHSLDAFERTLGLLGKSVREAKDAGVELESSVLQLQQEEAQLKSRSTEINQQFKSLLYDQLVLQNKVTSLEKTLSSLEGTKLQTQTENISQLKATLPSSFCPCSLLPCPSLPSPQFIHP
ncbi:uncharacterized protein angptl8 [Polyodon spathula]|uniref:uncharacterized protein angptl8 n=1 Tax=Polyodon spathula TaxID=7913 RepID=UPI001B7DFC75|nr:uncharacterized protein angptl8 [Polyodon spathula]